MGLSKPIGSRTQKAAPEMVQWPSRKTLFSPRPFSLEGKRRVRAHPEPMDTEGPRCCSIPRAKSGARTAARTTPHMYVINGEGALVYNGGIDDRPTARLEDLKSARNFVDQVLSEISQGKPVSVTSARAYGCSIKYGSFRGGILPNPRADGSKIGRIPLTRHAAWSAKFEK